MLINETPIEKHNLGGRTIYVKREDLSCPLPGPPFSKMRGVVEHIASRPEKIFGVLDTYHSKAGWAVAYACKKLRRKCVNFYPVYKADDPTVLREPQVRSKALGARLYPLPAGRSFILYNRARTLLKETMPGAYLMPNALKLDESIEATAREVIASKAQIKRINPKCVVVSVSSATIATGVMIGFQRLGLAPKFILHEGYTRDPEAIIKYIDKMAKGVKLGTRPLIIDEGYAYKDTAPKTCSAPFPCNPWYDLKAWHWIGNNLDTLADNILFWSVGN